MCSRIGTHSSELRNCKLQTVNCKPNNCAPWLYTPCGNTDGIRYSSHVFIVIQIQCMFKQSEYQSTIYLIEGYCAYPNPSTTQSPFPSYNSAAHSIHMVSDHLHFHHPCADPVWRLKERPTYSALDDYHLAPALAFINQAGPSADGV